MRLLPAAFTASAALALAMLLPLSPPLHAEAGSEQFRQGRAVFAEACAICHGETGQGGPGYANPIWGDRAQIAKYRTAQGLFEYHQMLMPFDDPMRLSDDAKWAVTLYVLANHGTMPRDATLDAQNAGSVQIR
jgi:mono/diheme cytochrome c family protein